MTQVRLGLVGAGDVAAKHLQAAVGLGDVTFAGVYDVVPDQADALARAYDVPAYASFDAMVDGAGLDAVVVAVPTLAHPDVVRAAAERKLHVLVEKPMAVSVADCDAMLAVCREAGVLVGVCHAMQRQHARLRAAKRVIDSGELGDVVLMSARRTLHYPADRPAWMRRRSAAGGGVLFNTGTYAIEEFQWLAGALIRRVLAAATGPRDADDVETDGLAVVELANGVHASVVELGSGFPHTEEMNVVLEKGALHLSHAHGLWRHSAGEAIQLVPRSAPPQADYWQALAYQLTDFGRAVRDRRTPEVDGEWGRSVVAAAVAIYDSARFGRPVRVPT
ncbi:Gfo/Idh/MocA family protein [Jiangella asiatica]|uniref:Gfo/Idh/MocA family oxidoreductase n=1 Tax=Jiangella asiatica TaxID=2530372 RepID=A0A4R5CTX9_9ACTN|nr:Gfo/Idh/MocA family oxidoreductase [Jiangella asiatica]TDE03087.1 Gfo/Idh/MocA family oxidoreductase [Jiangella asiatica]